MPESLTALAGEYQVLTELYRAAGSVTYLARHLNLTRDVTITVVSASTDDGKTDLAQVESDVRTLIALRHPNIVPVLEGRALDRRSFVVVRARVRGSTLDQLISAIGLVPLIRVRTTLEQVHAALTFARTNGVVARHISPEALVFQQGSGRVLVAFDSPPATAGTTRSTGEDEDIRTIGRLARMMLSGRQESAEDWMPLAELRPDLPHEITGGADELAVGGNSRDVIAFLTLLDADARGAASVSLASAPAAIVPEEVPLPLRRATVARTTVGPMVAMPRVVTPVTPVATIIIGESASTRPRRFGIGTRWATGFAVVVLFAAGAAIAILRPHFLSSNGRSLRPPGDSGAVATGDVAATKTPIVVPPVATPTVVAAPDSVHPDTTPAAATAPMPIAPVAVDSTVKPEPPVSAPPSNVTANAACASTLSADQRKCFADAVQRADADLGRVYNALIAALRRQAKSAPEDPDPPTVDKLRSAQRAWLDERDRSCQVVGAGIFSGRDRGQCFADRAAKRSRDLQLALDSIPAG